MEEKSVDIREELHNLAEQLPEEATWQDVFEYLRFRMAVEEGKKAANDGIFANEEEVNHVFAKYGVNS